MKLAATIIILISLAIITDARAVELEIGGGRTLFHAREGCAIWSQCNPELVRNNEFKSWGYQIGAKFYPKEVLSYRLAWVNFGHFYANNTWVSDASVNHSPLNCSADPGDCRSAGGISGSAYGPSGGLVFNFKALGWRQELEVGGLVFRSYQTTNICPIDGQGGSCTSFSRMYGTHRTWYAGAGIGKDDLMLNLRIYQSIIEQGQKVGGEPGITGGLTPTLFLTYKF